MAKQDEYVRYTIRVPAALYDRIQAAAGEKSVNAEIVATLEAAYPAPVPFSSDLIFMILQWADGEWRLVDEADWSLFRAGKKSNAISKNTSQGDNFFAVIVLDEQNSPVNIITHNYRKSGYNIRPAQFDFLSSDEKTEYSQLYASVEYSDVNQGRLRELQHKMEAAFVLSPEMADKLRRGLLNIAPQEVVDQLIDKTVRVGRSRANPAHS